jgi:N-glycosidase YbiA
MAIYFYRVDKPYGAFSNFAKYSFEADGKYWPTSEHYFQAQKFSGTVHEEVIRQASSARHAAEIGRDPKLPLRSDWQVVKLEVMRTALRYTFASHRALVELLVATGDEEIIEQTTDDYYWGCGSDSSGVNMLGRLLMELREEYRRVAGP